MKLVRCDMCFELHQLDDFPEGEIFICVKCAKALSELRQEEIRKGIVYTDFVRMAIFEKLRGI